ncbi:MAG: F0F1 ATP synthase subunit alpha [Clostridiales bacterium]|nr:F0F1 ATP synthase subunit alpha [Clostridiales bacterium]
MARVIEVTSAVELNPSQIKKIEKVFSAKHKPEKVEFVYKIDRDILGGLLVVDGEDYYDGTMRSQLGTLNSQLHAEEAAAPPKRRRGQKRADDEDVASDIIKSTDKLLARTVGDFKKTFDVRPAGSIEFCGDGVIMCSGLASAEYGEMLEVENGVQAIVLSLTDGNVGAIVLDDEDKVSARMLVKSTGMIVSVPVGEQLLGRVVNPLGKPIDGAGDITTEKFRPIESPAPAIKDRDKVNTPMQTGILAIDSMIPIGKGQRELIIGDRQTGKTSIAVDTILNQKGKNVICVYVAIGQKSSTVSSIVNTLNEHGAMDYTVIVSATARDSPPLQYIAPYAGCAIAEEFMYAGRDVLIVYDDLSKHAVAYRAMSLLLKRPPGREAYPGDIFYLHSRLLERAAKLSGELGGGSITALPIVETQAGDISAYIPTNIISITDGQIYLESDLFNADVRPAINVGLSVSRVGGSAQTKAMRKVSGKLRLDLSQYRELAVFARFGADLDQSTTAMLEQGKRTTEIIKQDVHSPMSVENQIVLLYVTTKELLNDIPVNRIGEFKDRFVKFFEMNYFEIVKELQAGKELSMDMCIAIEDAVREFELFFLSDGEK